MLKENSKRVPAPVMRKYYQLALVIVSLVSLVMLLFYRHEYNRLRYVMEVLSFFGKPGGLPPPVADCIFPNVSHGASSIGISEVLPSWQRLTSTHYVYSAFWEAAEGTRQVKALSLEFGETVPQFGCSLWLEDRDTPIPGRFSFSKVEIKSGDVRASDPNAIKTIMYYLMCRNKDVGNNIPYGVTFHKTDDLVPSRAYVPVHQVKEWGEGVGVPHASNSTAICVAPGDAPGMGKATVTEFLSYHVLVGVTQYVVYEGGLPATVRAGLKSIPSLSVEILPWNFPFPPARTSPATKAILEMDCLLRTAGRVHNIALLGWNEYVVPRYHHLLAAMLDDFDSGRKSTARFEIPTIVFCTEFADDDRAEPSSPLVLRKTRYSKLGPGEHPFYVYRPHLASSVSSREAALTTQRVSQGIAAVHRYALCNNQASTPNLYEPAMLRFAGDLKRSTILRAWSTGKLFH